jgi:hypothetical protein
VSCITSLWASGPQGLFYTGISCNSETRNAAQLWADSNLNATSGLFDVGIGCTLRSVCNERSEKNFLFQKHLSVPQEPEFSRLFKTNTFKI